MRHRGGRRRRWRRRVALGLPPVDGRDAGRGGRACQGRRGPAESWGQGGGGLGRRRNPAPVSAARSRLHPRAGRGSGSGDPVAVVSEGRALRGSREQGPRGGGPRGRESGGGVRRPGDLESGNRGPRSVRSRGRGTWGDEVAGAEVCGDLGAEDTGSWEKSQRRPGRRGFPGGHWYRGGGGAGGEGRAGAREGRRRGRELGVPRLMGLAGVTGTTGSGPGQGRRQLRGGGDS